ncbi:MAG: nucleotidyltransferase domain-containing protein [Kyrpidia sp.]|nr:nucleotidyltransferase domain-containing protein [Kyrpidia sp.]
MEALEHLQLFGPRHRDYVRAVLARIRAHYADRLSALAIYGSYARWENRLDSDLDLLVLLRKAPSRRERIEEFIRAVEMPSEPLAQELYERDGVICDLSPMVLTEQEGRQFQPVYADMVDHCVVIVDRDGALRRILTSVERLLRETGARKVRRNNTWEWQYGRFLGGVEL